MGKFFSLVHNEYVKIFKKKTIIVMIVLLVISCFGFSFIMKQVNNVQVGENFSDGDTLNIYKQRIEYLKETKEDGWEQYVKALQFLVDNNLTKTWQESSLDSLGMIQDEEKLNKALEAVKSGDSIAYCNIMKDIEELDEGSKWEYAYRAEHNIPLAETERESYSKVNKIISSVHNAKTSIATEGMDENSIKAKEYKDKIDIGIYQLDNGIDTNLASGTSSEDMMEFIGSGDSNFWDVFASTNGIVSLAGLFLIIIAGGTIASEFSNGTIKFLLINPVKRWKILMSKYFACMTTGLFFVVLIYIISIPAVGIFNGFEMASTSYIYVKDGAVKELSPFLYVARQYLLSSVDMVVMGTMAFAISSLARNAALAIGASLFGLFMGSSITSMLAGVGQDWGRYLIFSNVDLASIVNGNSLFAGQTLGFALVVIAIHMVVFLLTAWDAFTKKSV